ncbi:hypothetical protein KAX17_11605 [Candidatus Bipolaricaulota bacterium]|nr:hypothetical protein [Candidatus Bipolaricaulota bacterium]
MGEPPISITMEMRVFDRTAEMMDRRNGYYVPGILHLLYGAAEWIKPRQQERKGACMVHGLEARLMKRV